ncbi:MAG: type I methionyl aminopeptidase, partial [Verrucomicrobiales bacterium]
MIPIRKGKQLGLMRDAGRIASEILKECAKLARPGISTGEIDAAAAEFMAERNCVSAFLGYRGFPGQICISLNEEVVHGIGSPRRIIQYGDIVKIDVGVIVDGWVGDNALTVPVGEIAPEVRRLLEVTEQSLHRGIEQARDGVRLGDLSNAIESHVRENQLAVVREFVGHGVGKKLHEEPQIPNHGRRGTGPTLRAGMILAIEPMVNLGTENVRILEDNWTVVTVDALCSAHFEHTVLVTDGDPEILTWRERLA